MRWTHFFTLLACGLLVGCSANRDAEPVATDDTETSEERLVIVRGQDEEVIRAEVKEEAKEPVASEGQVIAQKRAEFQESVDARMATLQQQIDDLKTRVQKSELAATAEQELQSLQDRLDAAKKQAQEAKAESMQALEDLRQGVNSAVDSIEQSLDQARSRFSSDETQAGSPKESAEPSEPEEKASEATSEPAATEPPADAEGDPAAEPAGPTPPLGQLKDVDVGLPASN